MDFDNNLSPVEPQSKWDVVLILYECGVLYKAEIKWKIL